MRSPLIRAESDGDIREYATDCLDAGPRAADDLYIYTADGEVRCRYGFNNGGTWTYDTQVLYRIVPTATGTPNADGYVGDTYVGTVAFAQAQAQVDTSQYSDYNPNHCYWNGQSSGPYDNPACQIDTTSSDYYMNNLPPAPYASNVCVWGMPDGTSSFTTRRADGTCHNTDAHRSNP